MIIDCPYCKTRVNGIVRGEHEHYDPDNDQFPYKLAVLSCPVCKSTLVGLDEELPYEGYSGPLLRVWPFPKRLLPPNLPVAVRESLDEADRCLSAGAFSASTVMAVRALEAMCIHHGVQNKTLANGLTELREKQIIDQRLFDWSEELRKIRNLGAHVSTERISREDAEDVLDFAHAITDYVFTLKDKFDKFMARRSKQP